MTAAGLVPWLLVLQGAMGGFDTLVNHELLERLPRRPVARNEIRLHFMREAIYGTLFLGLAWREWHGMAALFIAALLVAEIGVTACDEWIENRIRVLPGNERVLHLFLTLNLGLIVALMAPMLVDWRALPDALVAVDHGAASWLLTLLGVMGWAWSVRDFLSWLRLRRLAARA